MVRPKLSPAEFSRRGDDLYERRIAPRLLPEDNGKYIAIDIASGDYEIGEDEISLADRLLARRPGAELWLRRVGARYTHRFGSHSEAFHP